MQNIFENAIKETRMFGALPETERDFHIALAGTPDYIPRLGVVLWSVAKANPAMRLAFHLFVNDLPAEEEERLNRAAEALGVRVEVHLVDDAVLEPLLLQEGKARYNKVAAYWYRFLAPDTLCRKTDRALYLDGDMMCVGDLRELQTLDLGTNLAAVVRDRNGKKQAERLGTELFFNSGFMLLNLREWKHVGLSEKSIQEIREGLDEYREKGYYRRKGNSYCDQNILNYLCDKKLLFLPKKYNYIYILTLTGLFKRQERNEDFKNQIILHFVGSVKAWHDWVQDNPAVAAYTALQKESPWRDVPLTPPRSHREIHQAARKARVQREWGTALMLYAKYFAAKL